MTEQNNFFIKNIENTNIKRDSFVVTKGLNEHAVDQIRTNCIR